MHKDAVSVDWIGKHPNQYFKYSYRYHNPQEGYSHTTGKKIEVGFEKRTPQNVGVMSNLT